MSQNVLTNQGPGWLHDGKGFVKPASYEQADEFARTGKVAHQTNAGAKVTYLKIVHRDRPTRVHCPNGGPTHNFKDWARAVFGGANP